MCLKSVVTSKGMLFYKYTEGLICKRVRLYLYNYIFRPFKFKFQCPKLFLFTPEWNLSAPFVWQNSWKNEEASLLNPQPNAGQTFHSLTFRTCPPVWSLCGAPQTEPGGGSSLPARLRHSQTVFFKHFQTKEKQKWQPYFYKAGRHILQTPPQKN